MQADRINEKVKEKNMDKESRVLTKIHVPGQESMYFCTCVSLLAGMRVCACGRVCTFVQRSAYQYTCEYEQSEDT